MRRERMDRVKTGEAAAERCLRPAAQVKPAAGVESRSGPLLRGQNECAIGAQYPGFQ
jgi:hypothetical protein